MCGIFGVVALNARVPADVLKRATESLAHRGPDDSGTIIVHDSLDLVELIMSLEEEFQLQISDEDAEKITTVQEAEDYIEEHLR